MFIRSIIIILFIFSLSACSTASQPTPMNNLQIRVAQLESSLDKKDQEIEDLKSEITTIRQHIGSIEEYQMDEPAEEYTSGVKKEDVTKTIKSDNDIIRITATPRQVQQALKNAGFYSGEIDGKIGAKTKQAIKDFQYDKNLKSDGIVGARTWDELKAYLQ